MGGEPQQADPAMFEVPGWRLRQMSDEIKALIAERDRLRDTIQAVTDLHHERPNDWWHDGDRVTDTFGPTECAHDFKKFPCPTVLAARVAAAPEDQA